MSYKQIMGHCCTIASINSNAETSITGVAMYKHAGDARQGKETWFPVVEASQRVEVAKGHNGDKRTITLRFSVVLNSTNQHGFTKAVCERLVLKLAQSRTINMNLWHVV